MEIKNTLKQGREISSNSKNKAKHLERILGHVDKFATAKDKEFLSERIHHLNGFSKSGAYNGFETFPFDRDDTTNVKKIIANANARETLQQDAYDIGGKEYTFSEVKDMASEILKDGRSYLTHSQVNFLGGSVANASDSSTFSAKQIRFLEGLKSYVDERTIPHTSGEKFDKNIYKNMQSGRVENLLSYACGGKMKISVPSDYLNIIRKKWYSPETGLNSLRVSIDNYTTNKNLRFDVSKAEPVFRDLERFYSGNSKEKSAIHN